MADIASRSRVPPPPPPPPHTSTTSLASYNEDTDGSEVDTVLSTPTSVTTDHSQRWSLASAMSTAFSRHSFIHHKKKRSTEMPQPPPLPPMVVASAPPPALPPRPVSTYHIAPPVVPQKSASYAHRASWHPRALNSSSSDGSLRLRDDSHGFLSVTPPPPPLPLPKHDGVRPPTPPRHHDDDNDPYLQADDPFDGASWSGSDLRQLLNEDNHDESGGRSSMFITHHSNGSSLSNFGTTTTTATTTAASRPLTSWNETSTPRKNKTSDHELVRVARLLTAVYEFEGSPQLHHRPDQVQDFCSHLKQLLEHWADHPIPNASAQRLKRGMHNVAATTNMAADKVRPQRRRQRRKQQRQQTAILRQRARQRRHKRISSEDKSSSGSARVDPEQVIELQQRLDKAETETRAAQQATRLVQADMHDKIQQAQAALRIQVAHLEQTLATVQRDRDTIEQRTLDHVRQQHDAKEQEDTDSLRLQVIELESRCTRMQQHHDQERQRQQRAVDTASDRQTQAEHAVQGVKQSLSAAERTVAELELKLEVAKAAAKKHEQQAIEADHTPCRQLETALQQELAGQQAEVAHLQRTLQQMQHERSAWEQRLREEFAALYYHEKEAYKVQISREMRMLANRVAEQDAEIESLERRQQQDARAVATADSMRRSIEARCNEKRLMWEHEERDLKNTVVDLENRISQLEQDALHLYSHNLKLAHQLGRCDT